MAHIHFGFLWVMVMFSFKTSFNKDKQDCFHTCLIFSICATAERQLKTEPREDTDFRVAKDVVEFHQEEPRKWKEFFPKAEH